MIEWLIIGFLCALLSYAAVIYNRLVRDRQLTRAGWSDIGVQLKRRHDLIPKLVDTVGQYAAFEKNTLEQVTALRTQAVGLQAAAQQSPLESNISRNLGSIFCTAGSLSRPQGEPEFFAAAKRYQRRRSRHSIRASLL